MGFGLGDWGLGVGDWVWYKSVEKVNLKGLVKNLSSLRDANSCLGVLIIEVMTYGCCVLHKRE